LFEKIENGEPRRRGTQTGAANHVAEIAFASRRAVAITSHGCTRWKKTRDSSHTEITDGEHARRTRRRRRSRGGRRSLRREAVDVTARPVARSHAMLVQSRTRRRSLDDRRNLGSHRRRPERHGIEADVVVAMARAAVVNVGDRSGLVVADQALGMHELAGAQLDGMRDGRLVASGEKPARDEPHADQGCERLATQLQS
jgi:hypothetical protein